MSSRIHRGPSRIPAPHAISGFTLIEIMIAMAILAVISILSAQTMKSGIQDREAVSNEIAAGAKVDDALRIIRNDVNAAFHYRDLFVTIQNNAEKPDATPVPGQNANPANPAAPPPPPVVTNPAAGTAAEPAPTPRPIPPDVTGFIGDAQSMYFTTLSNARTIQDSQVSDQAKVGYYVKSCRIKVGSKVANVKCLYRSITPYLDEQVDTPATDETVLLENIDQFKLRYVGPGGTTSTDLEFVETWKTGKNGDSITKDNFPYAVEVTIVTDNKEDKNAKKITASALIPIRFPNNPPKKADGTPGTTPDGSTPTTPDTTNNSGSFNQGVGPGTGGTR